MKSHRQDQSPVGPAIQACSPCYSGYTPCLLPDSSGKEIAIFYVLIFKNKISTRGRCLAIRKFKSNLTNKSILLTEYCYYKIMVVQC